MSLELFPGKHLFVDDFWIERLEGAKRVLHQPVKSPNNPLLRHNQKESERSVQLVACAYDEEQSTFRLWYVVSTNQVVSTRDAGPDNPPTPIYGSNLCYLESADGITWEKPALGIVEFADSKQNNIMMTCVSSTEQRGASELFLDPREADPQQRYKMMLLERIQKNDGETSTTLSYEHSPDGIHWKRTRELESLWIRPFGVMAFVDEKPRGTMNPDARYIIYGQRGSPWATRQIGRRDSDDLLHWSENWPVLESSLDDTPGLEFYALRGPVANVTYGGLYLGMLWPYYTDLSETLHPARNEGVIEPQLAYSRDTIRWHRWDEALLPRGEPGAFDAGMLLANYPVIAGEQLYFFYTGSSATHAVDSPYAIGMATLRLDGFVSVQTTGFAAGKLITRSHRWNCESIYVNADAQFGDLKVQLQDETGQPLEGYSFAECDPIHSDSLSSQVTWKSNGDVTSLSGRWVALQFLLAPNVKLYSYTLQAPA